MEDREIIAAIKRGEIELFKLLVERYQQSLLGFIHSVTRNRMLTEDVGQAVFLSFFRSLDRYDETLHTPVAAWLFTVARNLAINALRRERRYVAVDTLCEELSDHRPGPPDLLIHREDRAILAQCLLRVPEPYRTTLMESLRGRSIEEIAVHEMVVPGTVKSRLVRAREKIIALFRAELKR
ncbi:MAG: sigma-70 family RNA polymerase sigma factor [Proteobacteria bacterium]|nr:sigma-70 family RNA polymerase sigma factor [Pseudomonadota bacterium]